MKKVAILGGGVGGLSAAHELCERGFSVAVYEANSIWGGKARSIGKPGTGTDGRKDLPGEHGFRFFPGFYRHLPDTIKRIPFPGNAQGVFGNFVATNQIGIFQSVADPITVPAKFPTNLHDLLQAIHEPWLNYLSQRGGTAGGQRDPGRGELGRRQVRALAAQGAAAVRADARVRLGPLQVRLAAREHVLTRRGDVHLRRKTTSRIGSDPHVLAQGSPRSVHGPFREAVLGPAFRPGTRVWQRLPHET